MSCITQLLGHDLRTVRFIILHSIRIFYVPLPVEINRSLSRAILYTQIVFFLGEKCKETILHVGWHPAGRCNPQNTG